MKVVVYLDSEGLEKVELISRKGEHDQVHRFYRDLNGALKTLDAAARAAAAQIQTS